MPADAIVVLTVQEAILPATNIQQLFTTTNFQWHLYLDLATLLDL